MGKNWKSLARYLGISDTDIDAITTKHSRELKEQCREALIMWKCSQQEKATRKALISALEQCKLRRIAQMLEKLD